MEVNAMDMRMGGVVCVAISLLGIAWAQPSKDAGWVGVWQGQLDGQPSVNLTLAEDTGKIEGTMVLNIISREGGPPHIVARQPHVLVSPKIEGNILSFRARRLDASSPMMAFTVDLTSSNTAQIHCLNCGNSAPVVEISKE
jgi:hypothetical protein